MSLNTIQLSGSMLAGLYTTLLIETEARPTPVSSPTVAALPSRMPDAPPSSLEKQSRKPPVALPTAGFLGSNKKNVTFLVVHPDIPFLPDGELAFLTNILAACKLTLADIAIANIYGYAEDEAREKLNELSAAQVILFGIEPLAIGMPINFPPFQLQQFDGRTYMHCASLSEIEQNKPLKGSLWMRLKTMFSL